MSFRITALCLAFVSTIVLAQEQDSPPLSLPTPTPDETIPPPQEPARYDLKRGDYKQDWREAGTGEGRLGDRLRSHVVQLNDEDAVTGKLNLIQSNGLLAPITDVKIRFVRHGEEKASVTPDIDGYFTVKDLEQGVYSMIASPSRTGTNLSLIHISEPTRPY